MAEYKYSYRTEKENISRAVLKDVAISAKATIEICSNLKNKQVDKAKSFLEGVVNMKTPVKYRRFTEGAGHKSAVSGSGKYPVNAATSILKAINTAESNAIDKGLSSNLKIVHISAQRAASPWRYGRQRRRKMKRTHIEVVLEELAEKKEVKIETKAEVKKVEAKDTEVKVKEVKIEQSTKEKKADNLVVKEETEVEPKVEVKEITKEPVKETKKEVSKEESKPKESKSKPEEKKEIKKE